MANPQAPGLTGDGAVVWGKTQTGAKLLIYGGYSYTTTRNIDTWRCRDRSCKGKLHRCASNDSFQITEKHSCGPFDKELTDDIEEIIDDNLLDDAIEVNFFVRWKDISKPNSWEDINRIEGSAEKIKQYLWQRYKGLWKMKLLKMGMELFPCVAARYIIVKGIKAEEGFG